MSFISLEVNDTDTGLQWFIELKRRITIVRGDSGIGKSELVRIIVSPPVGVEVKTTLDCVIADNSNWDAVLGGTVNSIIILDDIEIVSSSRFAKKVKETEKNQNYFLIIGREQLGEQSLYEDNLYKLSYSVDSVLRFVISEDGKKHYTEPFFNFHKIDVNDLKIRNLLIEDSVDGFEFFRHLLRDNVISAKNGKSSITEDTKEIVSKTCEGLLVLFDKAAFGCHIDKFYYVIMQKYKNVYIDVEYECFEYLLLNTNFFRENEEVQAILSNPTDKANHCISWESFYKSVLEKITKGTEIKYVHGNAKFRECWYESCDDFEHNSCNPHIQKKMSFLLKRRG